jgi:hypothetical protein
MNSEVEWAIDTLKHIQKLYLDSTNEDIKSALLTGVHKANGQLASAIHEIRPILEAVLKDRKSGSQKYGDVHVGRKNDVFSKTIELKSKTDVYVTNVDEEIRKGLNQLQGETKHNPRPNDVWVLDISIANAMNRWPFTGDNQARTAVTGNKLLTTARERLKKLIDSEMKDPLIKYLNSGWNDVKHLWGREETVSHLEANVARASSLLGNKSTRPVFYVYNKMTQKPENVKYLPALTIKIRYDGGMYYPVTDAMPPMNSISSFKIQLPGVGSSGVGSFELNTLDIKYAKIP